MGFVIPGWIPLPPPSMTQEQVVAMYQQNLVNIRIGGGRALRVNEAQASGLIRLAFTSIQSEGTELIWKSNSL